MTSRPPTVSIDALLERYEAFFLDAYGVLVDGSRALPGAAALVRRLRERGQRFALLSNDASRLPATCARRYRTLGVEVEPAEVITSGSLLAGYFRAHDLVGKTCTVLGPDDSGAYVREAGGILVEPGDDAAEVTVIGDESGFPFLPTIEAVLSAISRRLDAAAPVHLVLPNPDLVYPKTHGEIGLASGSIALVIEAALRLRHGESAPRFARLGKPFAPMFEAGLAYLGSPPRDRVLMLGDQLHTDVLGANDFGIDVALVGTGLTPLHRGFDTGPRPTWLLEHL